MFIMIIVLRLSFFEGTYKQIVEQIRNFKNNGFLSPAMDLFML